MVIISYGELFSYGEPSKYGGLNMAPRRRRCNDCDFDDDCRRDCSNDWDFCPCDEDDCDCHCEYDD